MRLEPLIAEKFKMKGSEKSRQSLLDKIMNLYCYGANDERGKLIELNIPSETETESRRRLAELVGKENYKKFWLNDAREYDTQDR